MPTWEVYSVQASPIQVQAAWRPLRWARAAAELSVMSAACQQSLSSSEWTWHSIVHIFSHARAMTLRIGSQRVLPLHLSLELLLPALATPEVFLNLWVETSYFKVRAVCHHLEWHGLSSLYVAVILRTTNHLSCYWGIALTSTFMLHPSGQLWWFSMPDGCAIHSFLEAFLDSHIQRLAICVFCLCRPHHVFYSSAIWSASPHFKNESPPLISEIFGLDFFGLPG